MNSKMKYNFETLQKYCSENNVELLEDYSGVKVNRDTLIYAKCIIQYCDNTFNKNFRSLIDIGGYCKKCSIVVGNEKKKQTCLKKFGVEYSLQNNSVREKSKHTIKEKYGVESISQVKEIRKKAQTTMLEKYGDIHAFKIDEFKNKAQNTMLENYGVKHPSQSQEIKEKIKNTCLEKYGVESPLQSVEIKEKIKNTCLEKYGVENPFQSQEIKEKIKNTCLEKYGVENPQQTEEIKEKNKNTCLEKYGVEYYLQTEEKKEKSKQTCLEKYGVEHSSQNAEIADKTSKNAYKRKEYTFPSGEIITTQGYENYALDELVHIQKIDEKDILTGCKNVPVIWYNDEDQNKHRHYVDIFIKSQNRCIEVKSTWTAEKKKDNIFLKQKAGKELGYEYEIWIYNSKGEKVECFI